jgi:cbb3-type cytochrome oxidase subunit 3
MQNNIWLFIQNNAPTIATIFFILFFLNVVYSVFRKGQSEKFNDYSKIPLNDKEKLIEEVDKNQQKSKPKNKKWFKFISHKLTKN